MMDKNLSKPVSPIYSIYFLALLFVFALGGLMAAALAFGGSSYLPPALGGVLPALLIWRFFVGQDFGSIRSLLIAGGMCTIFAILTDLIQGSPRSVSDWPWAVAVLLIVLTVSVAAFLPGRRHMGWVPVYKV
jgi:hypothetical protein